MTQEQERAYVLLYRRETDEQLYQRLRDIAARLGRPPLKSEVPAAYYLKTRLGSWPRILEKAGLKPLSERRWRILEQEGVMGIYFHKLKKGGSTTSVDSKQNETSKR